MTKIKICGLTRESDIEAVNQAMPDYAGFVFAKSRRQISPARAQALRRLLNPAIQTVGIFVNEHPEVIEYLTDNKIIDIIQLHGEEKLSYLESVRSHSGLPIIRSVSIGSVLPELPTGADYLLFDTSSENRGGSGTAFSWDLLKEVPDTHPYFLAGGLTPNNVGEAICRFHPFAVDVSSGVETEGLKDPEKIIQFVTAVREAENASSVLHRNI